MTLRVMQLFIFLLFYYDTHYLEGKGSVRGTAYVKCSILFHRILEQQRNITIDVSVLILQL